MFIASFYFLLEHIYIYILKTIISFSVRIGLTAFLGGSLYLDKIKNFEQRRTLTRFRISAHKLAIETGRYKGIPRHDRICTRCTDNTVEDERHFLFSCNYHTQEGEALMSIINENCKNFHYLIIDAKLVWLLNIENIDILCALCTFLKHI